jgi:ABC-type sugar transport system ATPase subunit
MAEVILKNISKVFDGGKPVVKNVNIDIKDKEFVVFVGSFGCGKSTTLRMIAGLRKSQKVISLSAGKESMTSPQRIAILPWFSRTMHSTRI